MFDVGGFAKEVGVVRDGRGWAMIFGGPLPLCPVNVLAIEGAGSLLGRHNGAPEAGDRYGRQQTNDSHDDHDFDQSESGFVCCLHGIPDDLRFVSSSLAGIGMPAADDKVHLLELCCGEKVSLPKAGESGKFAGIRGWGGVSLDDLVRLTI